jgi:hypothetical protein
MTKELPTLRRNVAGASGAEDFMLDYPTWPN